MSMRGFANGKKLTEKDREELRKFGDFLRDVARGQNQLRAYAEIYGETVYDATQKQKPERDGKMI